MKSLCSRLGRYFVILVMFFSFILSGCANPGLYYWGEYEASLADRYVENDPGPTAERLHKTMLEAEQQKRKIPPGVNADYGFLLYTRGDKAGAISYFERERQLYPESTALMSKLIEKVKQQSKPKDVGSEAAPQHPAGEKQ